MIFGKKNFSKYYCFIAGAMEKEDDKSQDSIEDSKDQVFNDFLLVCCHRANDKTDEANHQSWKK